MMLVVRWVIIKRMERMFLLLPLILILILIVTPMRIFMMMLLVFIVEVKIIPQLWKITMMLP